MSRRSRQFRIERARLWPHPLRPIWTVWKVDSPYVSHVVHHANTWREAMDYADRMVRRG